jgi:hypothetical protein
VLSTGCNAGVAAPGAALATGSLDYPPPILWGISCPSTGLCVAVDDKGHAVISTDPTAGTPTWSASATHLVGPNNAFTIDPPETLSGGSKRHPIDVSLNGAGRRLLTKFKRLPATLTLTASAPELRVPPTTITIKTVRVTFKGPTKKAPHRPKTSRSAGLSGTGATGLEPAASGVTGR